MQSLPIEELFLKATVTDVSESDADYQRVMDTAMECAKRIDRADLSPVGENNKPRMLQITAWIAHTETPNKNGLAFKQADIEELISAGMFQAPYFGMIDFNHDFRAYGAWYEADLKYDKKAKQYGIMAKGALFAWAYPELTDKVLAMQARNGFIDVSMGCMTRAREAATTADGQSFVWGRNPVFFTTSLLDVAPADPHSQGIGSEDPAQTSGEREKALMKRAAAEENPMENENEDVTPEAVEEEVSTATEQNEEAALEAESEAIVPEPAVEEPAPVADVAALQNEIATLKLALSAAEITIVELAKVRVEFDALKASLEAAKADEAKAKADVEKAARKEARLAELPETVRASAEAAENADVLAAWVEMDDAHWEKTKSLFAVASANPRKTRVESSEEEGHLAVKGDGASQGRAIDRWLDRRSK